MTKSSRLLLKISGEMLSSGEDKIEEKSVTKLVDRIEGLLSSNAQIACVLGGGNILRGRSFSKGLDRSVVDRMGMLATAMNGMALANVMRSRGILAEVVSPKPILDISSYSIEKSQDIMSNHGVVICVAGTGNPFVSTDVAAIMRGLELQVDKIIKLTKVDGVYDKNPSEKEDAGRYRYINYKDYISLGLEAVELSAVCLVEQYKVPIVVCDMNQDETWEALGKGQEVGTIIGPDKTQKY